MMMIAVALLVTSLAAVQGAGTPGRALFWSSNRAEGSASSLPVYHSQSSSFLDVQQTLARERDTLESSQTGQRKKDLVVTFCAAGEGAEGFFTSTAFSSSVRGAERAVVMPNVYHSQETQGSDFCELAARDSHVVSVEELLNTLSSSSDAHENYLVKLHSSVEDSSQVGALLTKLHEKNALIVGLQNPSVSAPNSRGRYSRLLEETQEEENYNPEGTEFTIYYKATYLYLTPDLFTGIMTFLFCAVVLFIGFSCLNQIQGPSTFVHNMPTLGKEG